MYYSTSAVHKLPQKPAFPSWEDGRPSRDHPTTSYSRGFAPMVPVAAGSVSRATAPQSSYSQESQYALTETNDPHGHDPHRSWRERSGWRTAEEPPRNHMNDSRSVPILNNDAWQTRRWQPDSRPSRIPSAEPRPESRDQHLQPSTPSYYLNRGQSSRVNAPNSQHNRGANSYYPDYSNSWSERESFPAYHRSFPRRSAMGDYKIQERRREADHFNHYSPPRRSMYNHSRYARDPSSSKSRSPSASRSRSSSQSRSRSIASSRDASEQGEPPGEDAQEPPNDSYNNTPGRISEEWGRSPVLVNEKDVRDADGIEIGNKVHSKDALPIESIVIPTSPQPSSPELMDISISGVPNRVDPSIHVDTSIEALQNVSMVPVPGLGDVSEEQTQFIVQVSGFNKQSDEMSGRQTPSPSRASPTIPLPSQSEPQDQFVTGLAGPQPDVFSGEGHSGSHEDKSRHEVPITVTHVKHAVSVAEASRASPKRSWEEAFTQGPETLQQHIAEESQQSPPLQRQLPPRHELLQPADNITEALRVCVMARRHADLESRNDRVERILSANAAIVDKQKPRSTYTTEINIINTNAGIREALSPDHPIRKALIAHIALKEFENEEKKATLEKKYFQAHKKWLLHCQRLDAAANKQPSEGLPIQGTRTTRRSAAALGDAVRSDLEMEQIMISLGNDDLTDPNILATRNLAKIPEMISTSSRNPVIFFDDTSGEVFDPKRFYDISREVEDWSEDEKKTFVKTYAQYPKQFGVIASALEHKTAGQCVLFYYINKKELIDFRDAIARWGGGRKKKGSGRKSGKQKSGALLAEIASTRRQRRQAQPVETPTNEPLPDDDMPRPRRKPKPKAKDLEIEMARAAKRAEIFAENEARRPKRMAAPLTRLLPGDAGFSEKLPPATNHQVGLAIRPSQSLDSIPAKDLLTSDSAKANYFHILGNLASQHEKLLIQNHRKVIDALEDYASVHAHELAIDRTSMSFVKHGDDPYSSGSRIVFQAFPETLAAGQITNASIPVRHPVYSNAAANSTMNRTTNPNIPGNHIENNIYKSPFQNPFGALV